MTNAAFADFRLHRLKKIEIVLLAEDIALAEDLLKAAGVGGWTILRRQRVRECGPSTGCVHIRRIMQM